MKEGGRANALLVELLLVIFFFMLAAAILVQLFADAKQKSLRAEATNASMLEAQNIAESLYGSDDPDAVLSEYGFTAEGEGWILVRERYQIKLTPRNEETEAGTLRGFDVAGMYGEEELIKLPSVRYIPKEVSP